MIDRLLNDEQRRRPSWASWLAHVRLLTFVLRYQFSAGDRETVDALVDDYDAKFDAAYKRLNGGNYRKPKHHMLRHLRKYLRLFGPFRHFWCMPGEAFLQPLKRWL
jgi:hypothetical protein